MIRVLLADDHPFIRSGIRKILHRTDDIVVVGEAENGYQALDLAQELFPDVLVLDIEMPGLKGFEVAHKLAEKGDKLPVLAVSAHEDRQFIFGMLAEGAYGYLTKDEVPETIITAIRGIAQGERGWVSRRVAARLAVWYKNEKPGWLELAQREERLLRLLLEGKTNQQIAAKLQMPLEEVEGLLQRVVGIIRRSLMSIS